MSDNEKKTDGKRRRVARRRARQSRKQGRKLLPVLAMAMLALGALYIAFDSPRSVEQVAERVMTALDPEGVEQVSLYFADPQWTRLVTETRAVVPEADGAQKIRRLVEALAKGPREGGAPILPEEAKLREVYLGPDGLVVIDFEPTLDELRSVGATGEMLTIFALVHTITNNVEGIRSVQILVDGKAQETLAGHVSISEPLTARPDLVEQIRK